MAYAEGTYGSGVRSVVSDMPPSPALTERYLRYPLAWKLLGKQFLVIGRRA